MGIIWEIIKGIADATEEENNDNKNEKLEQEMDSYGLEEWQKDEVRKGNYDPWSFEEDGELEEEDYYYEDDE